MVSSFRHVSLQSSRYLAAELLGFTVFRLFPEVELLGGGLHPIGFFYDFSFSSPLPETVTERIELELRALIKDEQPLTFISMMRENAFSFLQHHQQQTLARIALEQPQNIIDLLQIENFYGVCPSFSASSTKDAGYIKILEYQELAQDKNQTIRIIGTSWPDKRELKEFVKKYTYFLKKQDHRLLGPQLDLMDFPESGEELGVNWHAKGMQLIQILKSCIEKQIKDKSQWICTPSVTQQILNKNSNALPSFVYEEERYQLRESLLTQHIAVLKKQIIKTKASCRLTEFSSLYKQCPSIKRWGLLSSVYYHTCQTTVCCTKDQVTSELISSLHFIEQIIKLFGFKAKWYVMTSRQGKRHEANTWLKEAMQSNLHYPICSDMNEESERRSLRVELRIKDEIKREWPISVLCLSPNIKETEQIEKEFLRVVFTYRVWESFDRFIALLIERYEGNFPLWLAPEQVRIVEVGQTFEYVQEIANSFQEKGIRVTIDKRQELHVSLKIQQAKAEKIPYVVVLGKHEREKMQLNVQKVNQTQSWLISIEDFLIKWDQELLSSQFNY
jgi:threonyl-tRNA synthetase